MKLTFFDTSPLTWFLLLDEGASYAGDGVVLLILEGFTFLSLTLKGVVGCFLE